MTSANGLSKIIKNGIHHAFFTRSELLAARSRRQHEQQNVHKHVIRRIFFGWNQRKWVFTTFHHCVSFDNIISCNQQAVALPLLLRARFFIWTGAK
jgi:hypothetical protein